LRQSTHFTRNKARAVYCAENCIILCVVNLNSNDPGEIAMLITHLREEHRDLDHAIARLVKDPTLTPDIYPLKARTICSQFFLRLIAG